MQQGNVHKIVRSYILRNEQQPTFVVTSPVVSSASNSLFATDELSRCIFFFDTGASRRVLPANDFEFDNLAADRSITLAAANRATINMFAVRQIPLCFGDVLSPGVLYLLLLTNPISVLNSSPNTNSSSMSHNVNLSTPSHSLLFMHTAPGIFPGIL